jgi:thymidylate synthase
MPLLIIKEKSICNAWQVAIARLLKDGDDIKTEYDDDDDFPSKDATVAIEVTEPFEHPMQIRGRTMKLHSKSGNEWDVFGCGADTFLVGSIQSNYIEEVIEGINDRFLYESESSFPYSYHDRIFRWRPFALEDTLRADYDIRPHSIETIMNHNKLRFENIEDEDIFTSWRYRKNEHLEIDGECDRIPIFSVPKFQNQGVPMEWLHFPMQNQLLYIVDKLARTGYSRRCQFTTWRPYSDPYSPDPPCLQRGWFRVINGKLKMQTTWRSRDLFRAWEANVNGMLYIQKMVLGMINDIRDENGDESYRLGSYTDFSNSLHIYGENLGDLLDLMERMQKRKAIHPELEEQIEPLQKFLDV